MAGTRVVLEEDRIGRPAGSPRGSGYDPIDGPAQWWPPAPDHGPCVVSSMCRVHRPVPTPQSAMAVGDRRRLGADRLLVASWRGEEGVALLTPRPDHARPGPGHDPAAGRRAAGRGVHRAVTSALAPTEADRVPRRRLRGPGAAAPAAPRPRTRSRGPLDVALRRGRRSRPRRRARRGPPGLRAVLAARRPRAARRDRRHAVEPVPGGRRIPRWSATPSGAGPASRGYLQRLAVDPIRHREGVGTASSPTASRWLRRHGVTRRWRSTRRRPTRWPWRPTTHWASVSEPEGLPVLAIDLAGHA